MRGRSGGEQGKGREGELWCGKKLNTNKKEEYKETNDSVFHFTKCNLFLLTNPFNWKYCQEKKSKY